jgi:hypothetical protein
MDIDAQIRINIPHKINGHDSRNVIEQMGHNLLECPIFVCIPMHYVLQNSIIETDYFGNSCED